MSLVRVLPMSLVSVLPVSLVRVLPMSLVYTRRLPTRGMASPYTGGLTSLHGGFDFPTRENDFPFAGAKGK